MDYEKKYKEALERAKDYHKQLINEDNSEWACEIENIFPELIEPKDEKIRKAIIAHIKGLKYYDICYGVSPKEMCDWLEKQGQNNSCIAHTVLNSMQK